jgi:hypothetical protein
MSVYATLIPETGRSSEDLIVRCEEKNESLDLPLWNISTPGSSGVMGVMACFKGCQYFLIETTRNAVCCLP